jgi:hypothetical protein
MLFQNKTISENLILRPLENNDYEKGFKECLSNLTDVNGLTCEIFQSILAANRTLTNRCVERDEKKAGGLPSSSD